ncbi:hypothetical protein EK21DRAFT_118181 [Setomelanomma holmii]|uniref:Uncharacterized protein n=1 Tax=Setomelanomma holmii TaxID=210430 RepID=A0A9P4LGY1_9PLEO|nr:hypothetical protein EK21DRAFT_118181 [Setomelanomma holmii]
MNKRKASPTASAELHIDSGHCSGSLWAPSAKRFVSSIRQDLASLSPLFENSFVIYEDDDGLKTPERTVSSDHWLKKREPLQELPCDYVRNDLSASPTLRLGKRADHDIISGTMSPPVTPNPIALQSAFLRDYNNLRQGESNVPRRDDIESLVKLYSGMALQSLVMALLKDIARLDNDLDIVKEENVTLDDENKTLVEEKEVLVQQVEEIMLDDSEEF